MGVCLCFHVHCNTVHTNLIGVNSYHCMSVRRADKMKCNGLIFKQQKFNFSHP